MKMLTRILSGLALALPLIAHAQVKLSALTGQYSLADASYGLTLNGTTDDGAEVNAALTTIGTGKTVVLPAGKTLLTCRPIQIPDGTTLIAYGATIKRCAQPASITTATDITSGTTTTVTVADASAFSTGEVIALVGATYYSYGHTIASTTATTITVSPAFQMYVLATGAAQASVTETLNVRRAGDLVTVGGQAGADNVRIFGLTLDGNRANFAAGCRWEFCTDLRVLSASHFIFADGAIINSPGEAIQEASFISGTTNTDITAYTTTALTMTSDPTTEGFKVGDPVALVNETGKAYDDGVRRIASIVGNVITLDRPTGLRPPSPTAGNVTTTDGLTLYALLDSNTYRNNRIADINGNAMHFSGSSGSRFVGNTVSNTNGDATVGHVFGAVTYSNYIYNSQIVNNTIDATNNSAIGIHGAGNDNVLIEGNTIRNSNTSSYAIDIYALTPQYERRVTIANNAIEAAKPGNQGGLGIRIEGTSASWPANADAIGPSRIQVVGNMFRHCGAYIRRSSRILVDGNTFDMVNDDSNRAMDLDSLTASTISNNLFWYGYAGLRLMSEAGTSGLSISGNTFAGQANRSIWVQAATAGVVIRGNSFYAPDLDSTDTTWVGVDAIPIGAQVIDNSFFADKGSACISQGSATADYSADGAGTIVRGNICRQPSGTMTDSIVVGAGSTGLIVTENYVWEAINDGGTATVTTPANVVMP